MIRATKRSLAALTFISVIAFAGCDAGTFSGPQFEADAPAFSLSPSEMTLGVGASAKITPSLAKANGAAVNPKSLRWSTTDETRATVDGDGVVKGVAPGYPLIIARSGNVADTTRLRIVESDEGRVGVKISPDTVVLRWINATATVSATVSDSDGTQVAQPGLTWKSLNTNIAQMDNTGVITARGVGVALIVATAACCDQADTSYARVEQVVDEVKIEQDAISLSGGSSVQLKPVALDRGGSRIDNASFTFKAANESVAKVSQDGVVTSQSDGSTTVTATSDGRSDQVVVTVSGGQEDPSAGPTSGHPWNTGDLTVVTDHRFQSGLAGDGWLVNSPSLVSLVQDPTAPFGPNVAQRSYYKGAPAGQGIAMSRVTDGSSTVLHAGAVMKISDNYVNDAANLTKIFYLWSAGQSKFILSAHGGQSFALQLLLRHSPGNTGYLAPNRASGNESRLTPGKWHTVEIRVESASAPEMGSGADGRARVWLDGVLTHDYQGLDTHFNGQGRGWDKIEWNTIRGGVDPPNPHDMWWWANRLLIATR